MSFPRKRFYQFGRFHVNLQQHLLLRDGEVVPLPPKAIDLLVVLVENSGIVLSIEAGWDNIRSDPRFDNLRGRVGLPK